MEKVHKTTDDDCKDDCLDGSRNSEPETQHAGSQHNREDIDSRSRVEKGDRRSHSGTLAIDSLEQWQYSARTKGENRS